MSKYGNDIFQGEGGDIFEIYWNQRTAQFKSDLIESEGRLDDEFSIEVTGGIVIGNIYENPELLRQ